LCLTRHIIKRSHVIHRTSEMNVLHGFYVIHRTSEINVIQKPSLCYTQGYWGVTILIIKSPNCHVPCYLLILVFMCYNFIVNTKILTSVKIHHEQLTKLIQFAY